MAWVRDASAGAYANAASSVSFSHTIAAGSSDRLVVISGSSEDASSTSPAFGTHTYNSTNATNIRTDSADNGSFANKSNLQYLLDASLPGAGTYTVVVNCASAPDDIVGQCVSYTGFTNQAAPEANNGNNVTTGTSVSQSLTTTNDNCLMIAACTSNNSQAHTATNGMTEIIETQVSGGAGQTLSTNEKNVTPAGSSTGGFSWVTSGRGAISIAAFAPSTGATVNSGAATTDGAAVATGTGASTAAAPISSDGAAVATGTGASVAGSVLSSDGVGEATAVGVEFIPGTTESGDLSSDGTATAEAVGESIAASDLQTDGAATAEAVGESIASADLSADGVGVATATGSTGATQEADISADGIGLAEATGASIAESAISSDGAATAVAVGSDATAGTETRRSRSKIHREKIKRLTRQQKIQDEQDLAVIAKALSMVVHQFEELR